MRLNVASEAVGGVTHARWYHWERFPLVPRFWFRPENDQSRMTGASRGWLSGSGR